MERNQVCVHGEMPTRIGPFRILSVLGSGGMGVVYRAEHADTGERVALKTIVASTHVVVSSIRREVRALSRLQHPGIVRIVASGLSDGLPWYAMTLLEGRTLRDHLRGAAHGYPVDLSSHTATLNVDDRLGDRADPPPPSITRGSSSGEAIAEFLLGVLSSVCSALTHLHEMGIVHRDLKPENVFVQADGSPVLVDLGISGEFAGCRGREEIDDAWVSRMGTLTYMSPEQIRGELVDARADLYAVGCILYECVTHRRVFERSDSFALQNAHLNDAPLPPSELVPSLPRELEQLILQLLEKDPQRRLSYASDVGRTIERILGRPQAPIFPTKVSYLYRPPFIGRQHILGEVKAAIGELSRNARGGTWFLAGESGVGKTRLANEVVLAASRAGVRVVVGQCTCSLGAESGTSDQPLQALRPLLQALADHYREGFVDVAERLLGPYGRLLSAYEPSLESLSGFSSLPEVGHAEGPEARDRVLAAMLHAILAFSAIRPLLLVIDDLHWADELSLASVRLLAEHGLEQAGLLLLATYRAEEGNPMIRQLIAIDRIKLMEVKRLGTQERRAMVQGMLPSKHVEPSLVDYISTQSNGNPFFMVEHLRAAISEGVLARDVLGFWQLTRTLDSDEARALPVTLAELILRRLQHLPGDAQRLLEAVSVFGAHFNLELMESFGAVDSGLVPATCALLIERQIFEDAEHGQIRFVHDGLREAIYSRLTELEQRRLHGLAAIVIEATYAAPDRGPYYADLGRHHSVAGARDRAAHYFALAAARAEQTFALAAAVRYCRLGLKELEELSGESVAERTSEILEKLGELLLAQGDAAEALSALQSACGVDLPISDVVRARRRRLLGRALERQHRHPQALVEYRAAEVVLEESKEARSEAYWHELVQIQVDAAPGLYFSSRLDELDSLAARARPIVESHGNAPQRSRFYTSLAQSVVRRHRYRVNAQALELTQIALAAGETSSDPREQAQAQFAHAFPLTLHGDHARAEPLYLRAIEGAERAGDRALLTRVLAYYGVLLRQTERASQTRLIAERTLRLAEKLRMLDYAGVARANLAWVCLGEGRLQESEQQARLAVRAWSELPPAYVFPLQWLARVPHAYCLDTRGQAADALREFSWLLGEHQMALPEPLAELISSRNAMFHELTSDSLAEVWTACRSSKYL